MCKRCLSTLRDTCIDSFHASLIDRPRPARLYSTNAYIRRHIYATQGGEGTCDYSRVGLDVEDCNIQGYESCQRLRRFTDTSFAPPSESEDLWSAWLCDYQSDTNPNKNAVPARALTDDINALLQAFSNNGSLPAPVPDGKAGQPVMLKVRVVGRFEVEIEGSHEQRW